MYKIRNKKITLMDHNPGLIESSWLEFYLLQIHLALLDQQHDLN